MANVIKHKRGSGSDPGASDLVVGELAIRTDTGKLFTKMDSGALAEIAGGGSDIAINTLSSSSGTGGGSATFNGSAYRFTLSSPPSVSAAQLLVSINGVIQKPVTGTGQPSEGFSVDGNDIILGDAPATGSDFFILTFRSLGVSVPADNSVTSAKIVDGTIVGTDLATNVDLVDNQKLRLGTSQNLQIYNNSNTAFLAHTTGGIKLSVAGGSNQVQINKGVVDAHMAKFIADGAVELFHAGSKKFETTSDGVKISGAEGVEAILTFEPDEGDNASDKFRFRASDSAGFFLENGSSNDTSIKANFNGSIELYHGGTKKFETTSSGVKVSGTNLNMNSTYIDFSGSISTPATAAAIYRPADNTLAFSTANTQRMVIDSAGRVRIGNESLTSDSKADHLIVGTTSGDNGLTIFSGTGNTGNIFFADTSTSASGNRMGTITYNHSANFMRFSTNGNQQRMRIDLNGRVAINTDIGSNEADEYGGFVSMKPTHNFTDGATNLSTSALKAVLRVRTSANSSMSLYMGGLNTARPYLQVGNLAGASGATASYDLYLNPYGGNVFFGRGIKLGSSNDHNSAKIVVQGTGNTSATNSVFFKNSDETELFSIRNDGVVFLGVDGASPYNLTTSSAANLRINSDGSLRRSTSSIRYKKDIADATFGLADVLKLKPKTFKNNATGEFADDKTYAGFTAEDIHDLGLTEFVQYNEDNEPDALDYGNMVALMAKAIQELNAKVEVLEAK